jgi:signal transduction histidine kinase
MPSALHAFYALLLLAGLYLASRYSFLLFHGLAELFSVVIGCGMFLIAWNAREFVRNDYVLLLGIGYLHVAGLDLLHTLAYKGMGVFPGYGADLPTQLWLAARYLEAATLLAAPLFLERKLDARWALAVYLTVTVLLLLAIFPEGGVFPVCYVEGEGLTSFKRNSEYVIAGLLLASLALLYRRRRAFEPDVLRLIGVAIGITVLAELAFTAYVGVYDLSNLIGHYLKLISFYLIYRAVIETGLRRPYSLLFRDLARREASLRAAHEALQRSQRQLVQAEKASALGTLVAGVAHELNNPITAMLHYTDYLKAVASAQAAERPVLEKIDRQARRCADIVQGLLTFSHVDQEEGSVPPVNLRAVVEAAVGLVRHRIEDEGVRLVLALDPDPPPLRMRANHLQQVLLNLLLNALDAVREVAEKEVHLTIAEPDGRVRISVSDTGPGIEEQNLDRVFDPFFSTKPVGEGTGLGLSVSRSIVEGYGGTLTVANRPRSGTRFVITLPTEQLGGGRA